MKKLRKVILCMLCVCMVCSVTACGMTNNGKNDAANNTTTDRNGTNNTATDNRNNDGVINDMGNAVEDGLDNVERGVDDLTDGNTRNNATNSAAGGNAESADYR